MFKKRFTACMCILVSLSGTASAQQNLDAVFIQSNFAFADSQYRVLMANVADGDMPQTFDSASGKVKTRERTWWCTGFYPGTLWYIYEQTKDPTIEKEAERSLAVIRPNEYFTGNHDLGFMMYCSFGNAYRITNDTAYKNALFHAANSLSSRFRPGITAIQSWNKSKNFNCPVIIDNMMNLELLEWVSQNGGGKKLGEIADQHANTTMINHFRPDYSSYHVIDYDEHTGRVLQKRTWQGYADSSSWARGQSWGVYGYTVMYRFTKQKKYLEQAQHIAAYILDNPRLPEDLIPYWDYSDPKIPNVPRDASAAAVMASGFLELARYTKGSKHKRYINAAVTILKNLSSPAYRAKYGEYGGFLLKHSTGALPFNSEVDVPLVYADYYYLEALKRYKDWYLK